MSAAFPGVAAELDVAVHGGNGEPVGNAVVTLHAADAEPGRQDNAVRAVMDQKSKQFVPHVLAVRAGTAVYFPNSDDIRHHVYSFSRPKRFEIKLYTGTPSEPIVFDKPGVVILGCNIHDWMMGYIYVADTPHFVKTGADGVARFENMPPGRFELKLGKPAATRRPPTLLQEKFRRFRREDS